MLDQFDNSYEYIFEILHQDMLEGDMPTPSKRKNILPISISILQDKDYRVILTKFLNGVWEHLIVLKIININKQYFQIGFEVRVANYTNYLNIGCFDH